VSGSAPKGLGLVGNTLALSLMFTERHTKMVEEHLIKAYMNAFRDAPLLNYRVTNR
jgi:hypothetical protein